MQSQSETDVEDVPLVLIVDDDEYICEALADLLRSIGMESMAFGSTKELLESKLPDRAGCLILDVHLPGINGLDLQEQIRSQGCTMSVIFMTGFGDIPMSVRAMKAGAVDFLTKPFRDQDMIDAVTTAVEVHRVRRKAIAEAAAVAALVETLTRRERDVLDRVVKGMMNKQIAGQLGITEVTVKLHRGNLMRKMQARSLAELVHKSEIIQQS